MISTAGIVILIIVAAIFVLMGVIFLCGRGAWMIAGYNTMSKADKAKVNMDAVVRFFGWIMLGYAAIVVLMIFVTQTWQLVVISIILGISIIGVVVYLNVSPRFKRDEVDE